MDFYEPVGPIKGGISDDLLVVKNQKNEFFICRSYDAFEALDSSAKYTQRIDRMISRTIFYRRWSKMELNGFTEPEKRTLATLVNHFGPSDENLTAIIATCEGADSCDADIFYSCNRVTEYRELKELGSNLSSGFGFPGQGFALVVGEFEELTPSKRIFLQIVHSYKEGYTVEHQELTPPLLAFSKLDFIERLFK